MEDNSIEQDTFTNSGDGRMWVMLFSGFSMDNSLVARRVARQFIENALGPHDEVAVISVLGTMSGAQGFTRSRQRMLRAVERWQDNASDAPGDPVLLAYRVLEDVSSRLGLMGGRRKSILFFDPPGFFAPGPVRDQSGAPRFFAQRDALRAATRNNVAVHVVSTAGLTTRLPDPLGFGAFDPLKALAGMRVLAEETGGEAIVNSNNFAHGFEQLVLKTSAYYLLGYTPSVDHRDGEFHSLTVRVRRPGLTVRARKGYYATEAAPSAPPVPPSATGLSRNVRDVLRLPLSVNGIGMELFAAPFRSDRAASILVGAELHASDLVLGPGVALEVGYHAMTNEGAITPGAFKAMTLDLSDSSRAAADVDGLRYVDRMAVAPGRHQLRFAVHQATGKTGMIVADVEVPDFAREQLSLSGIVLTADHLRAQPTLSSDAQINEVLEGDPTALRRFGRKDSVRAYVEAYTNSPTRMQEVAVRATVAPAATPRQARDVATRVVTREVERAGHLIPLNLAELEAGDYVLTVEARAGRRRATRQLPFSVTPTP